MRVLKYLSLFLVLLAGGMVAADYAFPEAMARQGLQTQRALAGLTLKTARIEGFEMPYLEGGSGPTLVLVHGFGADKDNFSQVSMWLTDHYRVIAPDLPGFGDASKPRDGDYSIDAQVRHLDQFLAAIGVDQAHFGGSSMGGWIIGSLAAAHPAKVQSLWMLGAAGTAGAKESEVVRDFRADGKYRLVARDLAEFESLLDTVFTHRPFLPYSVRVAMARRSADNYAHLTGIFDTLNLRFAECALDTRLKDLAVPALIVFGDGDRAVDPSAGEVMHKLLPNSRLIVMPGVGHLPMLESPRKSAMDYIAFRQGLGI